MAIVVRFKVHCQPDQADLVAAAMADVVTASRQLPGVVAFDVGRDVTDPAALIATEVFDDAAARQVQESLPEVAKVMSLMPTALAAPPDVSVFEAVATGTE